jgi:hypothetical protein
MIENTEAAPQVPDEAAAGMAALMGMPAAETVN